MKRNNSTIGTTTTTTTTTSTIRVHKPTEFSRKQLKVDANVILPIAHPYNNNSSSSENSNSNNNTQKQEGKTQFPILYKQRVSGAVQMWQVKVEDTTIVTVHGQLNGKLQTNTDVIMVGKNIGQVDETTPAQQARNEAQSDWEKKKKSGYVEEVEAAEKGEVDTSVISGGIVPMLAHKFSEHGHKIVFPAFAQPKLDGERAPAEIKNGQSVLYSRTRKVLPSSPHINAMLTQWFPTGHHIVDGELYNHDYRDKFEVLMSYINQKKQVKEGCDQVVQYHMYDCPRCDTNATTTSTTTMPFDTRFGRLIQARTQFFKRVIFQSSLLDATGLNEDVLQLIMLYYFEMIQCVETLLVSNQEELTGRFIQAKEQGYEGAMARNAQSLYEHKRSFHLQKIKEFDDDEFKIIGIEEGRGNLTGMVGSFVCETQSGISFKAKMDGTRERLREFFCDHSLWQGKQLTVVYQGLTNGSKPRFPIGKSIRSL